MDIDGEFLTKLRDAMLDAVVRTPMYPWPGPPPGMEAKPSSSYMGEHACMRRVYLELMARLHPDDFEVLQRPGDQQVPAQRGWALENTLRYWLGMAQMPECQISIRHFDGAVLGPGARYFGHPDDWVQFTPPAGEPVRFLLEYKHQRVMAYSQFLKQGVLGAEPLYYAQAQSMLAADEVKKLGINACLFIITPFDVSAAKGNITMGKRRKDYAGELEPDFRTVPDCSGVHPVFYLELIPAMPSFQRGLLAWAKKIDGYVESQTCPPRKYEVGKDWQCDYCDLRYACEQAGPCLGGCEHAFCASQYRMSEGEPWESVGTEEDDDD